jgi:hypothetical protein
MKPFSFVKEKTYTKIAVLERSGKGVGYGSNVN